jgi:hypothetical protein
VTTVDINDPNTPLEDLPPVELVEADAPDEEPPEDWGEGGDPDGS